MSERLGSYQLEERLAVGGMAEIFRAHRLGADGFAKPVVIKRILPALSRDPQFVEMLREEARLSARLSCGNLVQVLDFGEAGGAFYLAMEYVEGLDLAALLCAERALPIEVAVFLGRELCVALEHLHGAIDGAGEPLGIVHRDVTPANVLLSLAAEVKLGDFGIAKARARALRTEAGTIKGKLAYLSPEQARGDEVDARTDLYCLGLLLFEVLTGQRYLDASSEPELLRLAERPPLRTPSAIRREIPKALDAVLARALALEPERRYPNARLLAEALALSVLGYDADSARERLRALVRRGRPKAEPAAPRDVAAAGDVVAADKPRIGGHTELIAAVDEPRRPRSVALRLALLSALAAVVATGLWSTFSPKPADAPQPARSSVEPREASLETGPAAAPPSPWAPPKGKSKTAVRVGSAAPTASAPEPVHVAPAVLAPALLAESDDRARQLLAGVDRSLRNKGLLADDAPAVWSRRQELATAVARGEAPMAGLDGLRAQIDAVFIDRAFIDAKLRRVDQMLAAKALEQPVQQVVRRRTQTALSHAVTGRYDLANQELNAIVELVRE